MVVSECDQVPVSVYIEYVKAVGIWSIVVYTLLYIIGGLVEMFGLFSLAHWIDNGTDQITLGLLLYLCLGACEAIIYGIATYIKTLSSIHCSDNFHTQLVERVLHLPMCFFQKRSTAAILDRCNTDMEAIDFHIPRQAQTLILCAIGLVGIQIIIAQSMPIFLIVAGPISILYITFTKHYLRANRLSTVAERKINDDLEADIDEATKGGVSIRAYRAQAYFQTRFHRKLRHHLKHRKDQIHRRQYFMLAMKAMGDLVILATCILALTQNQPSATFAIAINYSLQMTLTLIGFVQMFCDMERNLVAVERITRYLRVEPECETNKIWQQWPLEGRIDFDNYSAKYESGNGDVLRHLQMTLAPSTMTALVGRTGAGKSSLALALCRMVETTTGSIYVDGVDISKMSLRQLRSNIAIIAQNPYLFAGSLRHNIDPGRAHPTEHVWHAVESAHLSDRIKSVEQLDSFHISAYGNNLSCGEKQLVCLARAFLNKVKILIFDEATASIDLYTEQLIQATIRQCFRQCTIITIAHRVKSLLDYDRILVMHDGYLVEDGSPVLLARDTKSHFSQLLAKSM